MVKALQETEPRELGGGGVRGEEVELKIEIKAK